MKTGPSPRRSIVAFNWFSLLLMYSSDKNESFGLFFYLERLPPIFPSRLYRTGELAMAIVICASRAQTETYWLCLNLRAISLITRLFIAQISLDLSLEKKKEKVEGKLPPFRAPWRPRFRERDPHRYALVCCCYCRGALLLLLLLLFPI